MITELSLLGEICYNVEVTSDDYDNDMIKFHTLSGKCFEMHHTQDCCESVILEDVCGDIQNLVGVPILRADEKTSNEPKGDEDYEPESCTYTFYTFATKKGYVDIRWFGSSNGYYSEGVDINMHDNVAVPQAIVKEYKDKYPEYFI